MKKYVIATFTVLLAIIITSQAFAAKGGGEYSSGGKGRNKISLSSLTIVGASSLNENTSVTYAATATWSNGSTTTITPIWSVNSAYATIASNGVLSASSVSSNQTVTVKATYSSGGVTRTASKSVSINDVSSTPTDPILPEKITLSWDPSTDPQVVGYRLYYKESFADDLSYRSPPFDSTGLFEGDSPVDIGTDTTATLNLPYDTTVFCFAVTTYNASGLESSYSNIVCTND